MYSLFDMSAFEVYRTYVAIKTHFTTDRYDYFRYGNNLNRVTQESFNKRNDIYFFVRLGTLYNEKDVVEFFVSNFIVNSNFYIKNMDAENLTEWKRRQQSISYLFKTDLENLTNECGTLNIALQCQKGSHSKALRMFLGGFIMLETLVMLNRLTRFANRYDTIIGDDVIWKRMSKTIKKYDPFVTFDTTKAKKLVEEIL